MLSAVVAILILAAAYAGFREGLFTAFCMLVNGILAGLAAFNFYEPIADASEPLLKNTFLRGYEDFFALSLVYSLAFVLLRMATNNLANRFLDFPAKTQQLGGAALGVVTGYLVAGFFICVLQTLPWHENFLDFEPRSEGESALRSYWPPDRAWLSMMRFAGAHCLAWREIDPVAATRYDRFETFDRAGTFELRYQRYRRYGEGRGALPYRGELNDQLRAKK